jgi:drug/metabolite transporter (DMT)-like permease
MSRDRLFDWTVLFVLVVVWGSAFAALKTAVGALEPVWVVAGRLWVGALTLGAVMVWRRERAPALWPRPDIRWAWYAGVGVIGTALPFLLFAFASTRLPSAVVAICSGATPVFTALLAHLFVRTDRLTGRKAVGVGLGFIGIVMLVGPSLGAVLQSGAGGGGATLALLGGLLGGIGYAVGSILTRQSPPVAATTGAFVFCLTGALTATPLALIQAGAPHWPGAAPFNAILFLGVGPTGLASAGWVWLVHRRGPVFGSFATYLSPVWATLVGVALLGERPGWTAYAALALILAGVANASRPPRSVTASA